jgi:hypothetical protein
MAWVVYICLLIDVAEADPRFGVPSALEVFALSLFRRPSSFRRITQ